MNYFEEGDPCPFQDCDGHLEIKQPENCSCHLAAPCAECETLPLVCSGCLDEFSTTETPSDFGIGPYRFFDLEDHV